MANPTNSIGKCGDSELNTQLAIPEFFTHKKQVDVDLIYTMDYLPFISVFTGTLSILKRNNGWLYKILYALLIGGHYYY